MTMKTKILGALTISLALNTWATDAPEECQTYVDQIKAIEKEMRKGYSASRGRILRDRKRELSDKLYKCKRKYG